MLKPFLADLHIHTVLSGCAEVEMIPPLIMQQAKCFLTYCIKVIQIGCQKIKKNGVMIMDLELKNKLKNLLQNIRESKSVIRQKLKWFAILFPFFILGCAIIYYIAIYRAEFEVDIATGIFFIGAGIVAISLTVWNVKSNEVADA